MTPEEKEFNKRQDEARFNYSETKIDCPCFDSANNTIVINARKVLDDFFVPDGKSSDAVDSFMFLAMTFDPLNPNKEGAIPSHDIISIVGNIPTFTHLLCKAMQANREVAEAVLRALQDYTITSAVTKILK